MKKNIKNLFYLYQKCLVYLSYYICEILFVKRDKTISWVIGTVEIANYINFLQQVLKPSVSVVLENNYYYKNNKYSYYKKYKNRFINDSYMAILFGYLASKHTNFFYIWNTGFLIQRDFEFKFLKDRKKYLVTMFVGSDIRSPRKMVEYANGLKLDTFVEYVANYYTNYLSDDYEKNIQYTARLADKYADLIFNAQTDQISYIKRKQFFPPYMYDKKLFHRNDGKFKKFDKIKIVHAPSSPIVKGTPLVRAAIKKLEQEGYNFEYIEIQKMPNEVVLEYLSQAHILLNQFYAFVPGVLGIEGMANHCAVLMSADPSIEKGLPSDSKDAWFITRYWQVYDHLKYLLDNPAKIRYYADNGYDFAYKHYTFEAAGEYIKYILKENGINE